MPGTMGERPVGRAKPDPSARADGQSDLEADMPGVQEQDVDEGLRHESADAANSNDTVDDLTGSSDSA